MKKIIISKNETEERLLSTLEESLDDEVVLVFPTSSPLATAKALNAIREKAAILGKSFSIESVDEKLVTLAQSLSIDAHHPFLNVSGQSLSDIVPPEKKKKTTAKSAASHGSRKKKSETSGKKIAVKAVEEEEGAPDGSFAPVVATPLASSATSPNSSVPAHLVPASFIAKPQEVPVAAPLSEMRSSDASASSFFNTKREAADALMNATIPDRPREKSSEGDARPFWKRHKIIAGLMAGLFVVGFAVWVIGAFFSWAKVSVNLKTVSWKRNEIFVADKTVTQFDTVTRKIPAEVFTQKNSITQLFPATGHSSSSQKARGIITIFNNYSTAPQQLIATTRFETKSGRMYRLTKAVTIPGAKKSGGNITASSIDAEVVADQAGPAYNLADPEKLTIPGFAKTAKFSGFYGLVKSITGGSEGETKLVSDEDIRKAKDKVAELLKTSLSNPAFSARPSDLSVVPGADDFQVTKIAVNPTLDADGNFSVFASAAYRAVAIRENDIRALLHEEAAADLKDSFVQKFDFRNAKISYSASTVDFDHGKAQVAVAFEATAVPVFVATDFAQNIAGHPLGEARRSLATTPGFAEGKISIWPFWVSSIPRNTSKIHLEVTP